MNDCNYMTCKLLSVRDRPALVPSRASSTRNPHVKRFWGASSWPSAAICELNAQDAGPASFDALTVVNRPLIQPEAGYRKWSGWRNRRATLFGARHGFSV